MTYAEAKEIKHSPDCDCDVQDSRFDIKYHEAQGYLEGSSQWKAIAERLTNALEAIEDHIRNDDAVDANFIVETCMESRADYEKLKGEK